MLLHRDAQRNVLVVHRVGAPVLVPKQPVGSLGVRVRRLLTWWREGRAHGQGGVQAGRLADPALAIHQRDALAVQLEVRELVVPDEGCLSLLAVVEPRHGRAAEVVVEVLHGPSTAAKCASTSSDPVSALARLLLMER